MAKLGGLISLCIFNYAYAVIHTDHYEYKTISDLGQTQSPMMGVDNSVTMCAMKCSSTADCITFCVDGTKNCYSQTSSDLLSRLTTSRTPTKDHVSVECNADIGLFDASSRGHLQNVQKIVSKSLEDINCRGKKKRTPVMVAARNGHVKLFHFLVSQGCDLSGIDDSGDNMLHMACYGGNLMIVKDIFKRKLTDIGVDSNDAYGWTPVFTAVGSANIKVVKFLVSKGCNLTTLDKDNNNILHVACMSDSVDMVKYILKQEIDGIGIESKGKYGRTPVVTAVRYRNLKLVKFLVIKGCNLKTRSDDNNNILHVACIGGSVEIVKYIFKQEINGVDMESKGADGFTPLITAVRYDNIEVVEVLIKNRCNLKSQNNDNILHVACIQSSVDMVRYILKQNILGIDIETRGHHGWTPVLKAARYGNIRVAEFLVSQGCNLRVLDDDNNNILHIACIGGGIDMVKYILKQNVTGIDVESKGNNEKTPVMIARIYGHKDVVDLLTKQPR